MKIGIYHVAGKGYGMLLGTILRMGGKPRIFEERLGQDLKSKAEIPTGMESSSLLVVGHSSGPQSGVQRGIRTWP
jgi:hypothetical protein